MSIPVETVESRQGNGDESRLITTMKFKVVSLVKRLRITTRTESAPAIHKVAGNCWIFDCRNVAPQRLAR